MTEKLNWCGWINKSAVQKYYEYFYKEEYLDTLP